MTALPNVFKFEEIYLQFVNDFPKSDQDFLFHFIGRGVDVLLEQSREFESSVVYHFSWYAHRLYTRGLITVNTCRPHVEFEADPLGLPPDKSSFSSSRNAALWDLSWSP